MTENRERPGFNQAILALEQTVSGNIDQAERLRVEAGRQIAALVTTAAGELAGLGVFPQVEVMDSLGKVYLNVMGTKDAKLKPLLRVGSAAPLKEGHYGLGRFVTPEGRILVYMEIQKGGKRFIGSGGKSILDRDLIDEAPKALSAIHSAIADGLTDDPHAF